MRDRKVFTHVLAAFRYGREDLDVLGLTFRKDLYLASAQVYPCLPASASVTGNGAACADGCLVNPPTVIASTGGVSSSSAYVTKHQHQTGSAHTRQPTDTYSTPPDNNSNGNDYGPRPLTRLQERLLKKLGGNAYPFYFKVSSFFVEASIIDTVS